MCILLQAILYDSHEKLNVARDLLYKASNSLAASTDDYRVSLTSCVLFCLVLSVLCRLSCLLPSPGLLSCFVLSVLCRFFCLVLSKVSYVGCLVLPSPGWPWAPVSCSVMSCPKCLMWVVLSCLIPAKPGLPCLVLFCFVQSVLCRLSCLASSWLSLGFCLVLSCLVLS